MKITTKSRYAIRAIYALCMLGGDKHPVSILRILEFEDISKKYLEQIFTKLKHVNIIIGSAVLAAAICLLETQTR